MILTFISGVNRICQDTEFMTGRNPGLYWRICWGFLTPLLMGAILLYTFATYEPIKYKDNYYPDSAYGRCFNGAILLTKLHLGFFSCRLDNRYIWYITIAFMVYVCNN